MFITFIFFGEVWRDVWGMNFSIALFFLFFFLERKFTSKATSTWTHDGKSTNLRLMSHHGLSHIHTSHATTWAMSLLVKRNMYLEIVEFKFNISHYPFIGYLLLRMSCGLRLRLHFFFLKQNIMDETPISHILIYVSVCNKCIFILKLM